MIGADKPRELALMMLWCGGELLVQERTHSADGGLGFWGGKIKEGEEPFDAAVRETNEEISIEDFAPKRPKNKQAIDPIEIDGWLVHAFQTSLKQGLKYEAKEGRAEMIAPIDMWLDPRLMVASRAVLREVVLKPNGLNDSGLREIEPMENK